MNKILNLIYELAFLSHAEAKPCLSLVESQINFGQISPLSEQTCAIEVNNDGDTPLAIHRIRACCGAKAEISATNIAPSESATLTVSLGKIAKSSFLPYNRLKFTLESKRHDLI